MIDQKATKTMTYDELLEALGRTDITGYEQDALNREITHRDERYLAEREDGRLDELRQDARLSWDERHYDELDVFAESD